MPPAAPASRQVDRFRADLLALGGGGEPFGVAVSGGPDSLALLLLAVAAFPGQAHAATVDHRLRRESREEALGVSRICAALGIPHAILQGEPAAGGSLQAAARVARYQALDVWLSESRLSSLLTAHHADDQAETVLMRLARGSGLAGLAGIRPRGLLPVPGSARRLLRPLLGWRRDELGDIVAAAGIVPAADPGNADRRFDRTRVRGALRHLDWLDPAAAARSAALLAEADTAIAWALDRHWEERVTCQDDEIRYRSGGAPREIVIRLLRRAIACLGSGPEPRGHELARLAAALEAGEVATLGGVRCSGGPCWRFVAAPPHRTRSRF